MVKLLKYEMKKQQTSRMVIGSILLVCVLGFALGMLLGREKLAAVSLAVMMMATFFVVFYVGIESILVLNRDLKTKQSYMLWMVPKSIWEILGSKFLAAILQMLIVFVMYVAVGLICILVTLQHTGHLSDLFKMIWQAGELYIDGLPSIIWGSAEIFLGSNRSDHGRICGSDPVKNTASECKIFRIPGSCGIFCNHYCRGEDL